MNKTLLIMAAGMGSRFGGLKQIEPVGPNGEFIIDYSIYDALKCGFTKVVFIIKEENYDIFKETIGQRVEDKIKVEYAFQRITDLPEGYDQPLNREKPWGTSHAILSARHLINEPFAIINADDFYGYNAINVAGKFLDKNKNEATFALIGYQVKNTLTENGSVKRGVCEEKEGLLTNIIESKVERTTEGIVATPLNNTEPFFVQEDQYVSMNLFAFPKSIFAYIASEFPNFLDRHKDEIEKCEYLIPDTVQEMIDKNIAKVEVLPTTSIWQGVTYKEDKDKVVSAITKLVENGEYPQHLWTK